MDSIIVVKGINCWSVNQLNPDTQRWTRLGYRATYEEAMTWANDIRSNVETSEIPKQEGRISRISQAQQLKDKGYSNVTAATKLGISESTFRTLLVLDEKDNEDQRSQRRVN